MGAVLKTCGESSEVEGEFSPFGNDTLSFSILTQICSLGIRCLLLSLIRSSSVFPIPLIDSHRHCNLHPTFSDREHSKEFNLRIKVFGVRLFAPQTINDRDGHYVSGSYRGCTMCRFSDRIDQYVFSFSGRQRESMLNQMSPFAI